MIKQFPNFSENNRFFLTLWIIILGGNIVLFLCISKRFVIYSRKDSSVKLIIYEISALKNKIDFKTTDFKMELRVTQCCIRDAVIKHSFELSQFLFIFHGICCFLSLSS